MINFHGTYLRPKENTKNQKIFYFFYHSKTLQIRRKQEDTVYSIFTYENICLYHFLIKMISSFEIKSKAIFTVFIISYKICVARDVAICERYQRSGQRSLLRRKQLFSSPLILSSQRIVCFHNELNLKQQSIIQSVR